MTESPSDNQQDEGDDAKEELAFIEPIILANLWWLIEE